MVHVDLGVPKSKLCLLVLNISAMASPPWRRCVYFHDCFREVHSWTNRHDQYTEWVYILVAVEQRVVAGCCGLMTTPSFVCVCGWGRLSDVGTVSSTWQNCNFKSEHPQKRFERAFSPLVKQRCLWTRTKTHTKKNQPFPRLSLYLCSVAP